MSKLGRNSPCHCGSGKKYKKCCEDSDRSKASDALSAIVKNRQSWMDANPGWSIDFDDPLTHDSNRIVDLIKEGKLAEAEKAALKLIKEYPDIHDGFERLATVHEARAEIPEALKMYQRALDVTLENDGYDEEFRVYLREKIENLEKLISGHVKLKDK